jgi:hypothetical protein
MADDDIDDLPYRGEYAKSGRASCKTCKDKIDKGVLRLAAMVQVSLKNKTENLFTEYNGQNGQVLARPDKTGRDRTRCVDT